MDKDNKYYYQIESIVRNHRKFPGNEAILDDIIDDVYSHAQSVINSINNTDVINSYLEKVVSTSMITVPKRLNYKSDISNRNVRVIEPTVPQKELESELVNSIQEVNDVQELSDVQEALSIEENDTEELVLEEPIDNSDDVAIIEELPNSEPVLAEEPILNEESVLTEEPVVKANTEFIDKMINSISADSIMAVEAQKKSEEELTAESDLEDIINETDAEELVVSEEDGSIDTDDGLVNYSELSDIEDLGTLDVDETNLDEKEYIKEESALDSPVDAGNYEPVEILQESEEDEFEGAEIVDSNEECAVLDLAEESNQEPVELSEGLEETQLIDKGQDELNLTESDSIESEELLEPTEVLESFENDVLEEQAPVAVDLSEVPDDLSLESMSETGNETIELYEDTEGDNLLVSESPSDFSLSLTEAPEELNDGIAESLTEVNTEYETMELADDDDSDDMDLVGSEISELNDEPSHKLIDYSIFQYNPKEKNQSTVAEGISEKLLQLDNEKPELNVVKVFDLKYKQKMTIEEIAQELQVDIQDVVATLNEIVDLV